MGRSNVAASPFWWIAASNAHFRVVFLFIFCSFCGFRRKKGRKKGRMERERKSCRFFFGFRRRMVAIIRVPSLSNESIHFFKINFLFRVFFWSIKGRTRIAADRARRCARDSTWCTCCARRSSRWELPSFTEFYRVFSFGFRAQLAPRRPLTRANRSIETHNRLKSTKSGSYFGPNH